jgi:hypothetical protein
MTPITTYYMSRIVDVPPHVASAAFDAVLDQCADDTLRVLPTSARPEPTRRARGAILRVPYGPMRVSVEIEPWSTRRSQLGLVPLKWGLRMWPSSRQIETGHSVLTRLELLIDEWTNAPLRDVVRIVTADNAVPRCSDVR